MSTVQPSRLMTLITSTSVLPLIDRLLATKVRKEHKSNIRFLRSLCLFVARVHPHLFLIPISRRAIAPGFRMLVLA